MSHPHLVDEIERQSKLAQSRVRDLLHAHERAVRAERFWSDLSRHLRSEHHAHSAMLLRGGTEHLHALRDEDPSLGARIDGLRLKLEESARAASRVFAKDFPAAASRAGLIIDKESRHPVYTLRQGFLRLDVDEAHATVKITPRDGQSLRFGVDMPLVIAKLQEEEKRLFGRDLKADSLLRQIHIAYKAVLRAESRAEGEEVPLRRVAHRLAKNLVHFSYDEFNVDLARLIQAGGVSVEGRRMHLNHTRNTRQGFLLNGLESSGYFGFISFKEE